MLVKVGDVVYVTRANIKYEVTIESIDTRRGRVKVSGQGVKYPDIKFSEWVLLVELRKD